jgi:uncharacterized protein YaaQ
MKLVLAVVQAEDAGGLLAQLTERGFRSTRIKTAGGFLHETNATVFLGVDESQVDEVLGIIRENCTTRRQQVEPVASVLEPGELMLAYPVEVEVGGATVFVMDVNRFERI